MSTFEEEGRRRWDRGQYSIELEDRAYKRNRRADVGTPVSDGCFTRKARKAAAIGQAPVGRTAGKRRSPPLIASKAGMVLILASNGVRLSGFTWVVRNLEFPRGKINHRLFGEAGD